METTDTYDALRAWARGLYPWEAGVELLIRSFPELLPGLRLTETGKPWIDPDVVLEETGVSSGTQQRVARIAASLLGGQPVDLSADIPGLHRDQLERVMCALDHAAGHRSSWDQLQDGPRA